MVVSYRQFPAEIREKKKNHCKGIKGQVVVSKMAMPIVMLPTWRIAMIIITIKGLLYKCETKGLDRCTFSIYSRTIILFKNQDDNNNGVRRACVVV